MAILIGGPNDMEKGLKELLEHKGGSGILLLFFNLFSLPDLSDPRPRGRNRQRAEARDGAQAQ